MKCIILALTIWAAMAFSAHSEGTSSTGTNSPIKKIKTTEATNHYGETLVVTGKIAQVSVKPTVVLMNLDQRFPRSPFTVVVFAKDTNKFGPLTNLQGKSVEITGTIKAYHDKPEIILSNAAQLTIVTNSTNATVMEKK